ncbi:MAG: S53 family peptidase, partial [Solirubrobacteraceae bacterium]
VQGVIGPGGPAPSASLVLGHPRAIPAVPVTSDVVPAATAGPHACGAAAATAAAYGGYTADGIAAAYGLSGYWSAGDEGQGATIALYELEPFSAADVAAYQACYGTSATVTVVAVDGGAGEGPGSGEAAMDVEDLIGLAPRATIRVYEAPANGAGAFDAYSRIVSDDSAQVISTSWGLCEQLEGQASAQAENTLFQEAAVQGQTVVAASGDQGSDDCGDGSRAVDDPASQPWVTGVGATSLQGSSNTVWNDSLGATGGGVSELWGRPSYQSGFAEPQSSVTCGASGTACREVPDLSLDGDPATGYVAYWDGGWRGVGGTSVAAPTVAALTALADASPACGGRPVGFLNQALYRAAAASYASSFGDVTSGSNSFDGVAGFSAGPGYDMASGLGTPGATLGQALCGQSAGAPSGSGSSGTGSSRGGHGPVAVKASQPITIVAPKLGLGHVGVHVRLRLRGHDLRGLRLRWSATGLPRGLRIDARTGVIDGVPLAAVDRIVHVRASDGRGDADSIALRWTVAGAPSLAARLV